MKKDKILSTSLSKLILKYSRSDVIFTMQREVRDTPILQILTADIIDNHFLVDYTPSSEAIERLVAAFETTPNIEPIVIRNFNNSYEVVIGRKRLIAAQKAGIKQIPALIREYTDEETLLVLLAIARDEHQISPIEIAIICRELIKNFDYSQKALAELLHLSRTQVTNILRLLTLPKDVLADLSIGRISYGHARAMITLPLAEIRAVNKQIIKQKLNVRETENLVAIIKGKKQDVRVNEFEEHYHAKLILSGRKIEITFNTDEDLLNFYEKILRDDN
ncbi:MAG: ParB/RepB/Spo0J family partition protein [Bacilli bacterium]